MSKRRVGLMMIMIGVLAVTAGLGLGAYNLWDNYRAGIQADIALDEIIQYQEKVVVVPRESQKVLPDSTPNPNREMPVLEIDGKRYIGTVSIPAVDIELPVQEDWSLELLSTSPCRYMGSVYDGGFIICGHNYATHFGRLSNLLPGDQVIFTDVEGNEFRYVVWEMHTIDGTAVDAMKSGDWDLTLFTCTLSGLARTTVRCKLIENGED